MTQNQKEIVSKISTGEVGSLSEYIKVFSLGTQSKYTAGGYFSGEVNVSKNGDIFIVGKDKKKNIQEFISLIYLLDKNNLIRIMRVNPNDNFKSIFQNQTTPNAELLHECYGYIDKEFRPLLN